MSGLTLWSNPALYANGTLARGTRKCESFCLALLAVIVLNGACRGGDDEVDDPAADGNVDPDAPGRDGAGGDGEPYTGPPVIERLWPESGSWRNRVTLHGKGFPDTAARVQVYFDGVPADILEASPQRLTVAPRDVYVQSPTLVAVTVVFDDAVSSTHTWRAMPSGSIEPLEGAYLREPVDMAFSLDGSLLWVLDKQSGLLQIDVERAVTRAVVPQGLRLTDPQAIAVHPQSGEVYIADIVEPNYNGATGVIRIVAVSVDGSTYTRVGELLRHRLHGFNEVVEGMTFDLMGNLYLAFQSPDRLNAPPSLSHLDVLTPNGWLTRWRSFERAHAFVGMGVREGALYVATHEGIMETPLYDGGSQIREPLATVTQRTGFCNTLECQASRTVDALATDAQGLVTIRHGELQLRSVEIPYDIVATPGRVATVPNVRRARLLSHPVGGLVLFARDVSGASGIWHIGDETRRVPLAISPTTGASAQPLGGFVAAGDDVLWIDPRSQAYGLTRLRTDGSSEKVADRGAGRQMAVLRDGRVAVPHARDRNNPSDESGVYLWDPSRGTFGSALTLPERVVPISVVAATDDGLLVEYRDPSESGWLNLSIVGDFQEMIWRRGGSSAAAAVFQDKLLLLNHNSRTSAIVAHTLDAAPSDSPPQTWDGGFARQPQGLGHGNNGTLLVSSGYDITEFFPDGRVWNTRQPVESPEARVPLGSLTQRANGDFIVRGEDDGNLYRMLP